jgi:hypothetical protein
MQMIYGYQSNYLNRSQSLKQIHLSGYCLKHLCIGLIGMIAKDNILIPVGAEGNKIYKPPF